MTPQKQETREESATRQFLEQALQGTGIEPAEFDFLKQISLVDMGLTVRTYNRLKINTAIENAYELVGYSMAEKPIDRPKLNKGALYGLPSFGKQSAYDLRAEAANTGILFAEDFVDPDPDFIRQRLQTGMAFLEKQKTLKEFQQPESPQQQFVHNVIETMGKQAEKNAEGSAPENAQLFTMPENSFDIARQIIDNLKKQGFDIQLQLVVKKSALNADQ